MPANQSLVPPDRIEQSILLLRGEKVMLDADLARLYEVSTSRLNEQVKRNRDRFPEDFAFQLTKQEDDILISQTAISNRPGRGGTRKRPWAFTEHGILMLSSVLRSKRAVEVNIEIMRTFVRLRRMIASTKHLAQRLDQLEKKYDKRFKVIFDAIRTYRRCREIFPGYYSLRPHILIRSFIRTGDDAVVAAMIIVNSRTSGVRCTR